MKRAIIFFFTLCTSYFSIGQFSPIYQQASNELKQSKLEIVLTGDERFDSSLKLVISDELTIYQYEFISKDNFEQKHTEGEEVFALILSKGEFDLPMAGGLVISLKGLEFYGIIREYHQASGKYKPGYSIVSYTLNVPGKDGLSLESSLRLYIRNLNNEVRGQGDDFNASLKERQDWAQEVKLIMLDEKFDSSVSTLKKVYSHDIEKVKAKRIHEAILNNEEVILCMPFIVKTVGGTTDVLYLNYFYLKDGVIVDRSNTSFLAKKNQDKYKVMKAKAEQKALKVYAKNVK